MDKGCGNSRSHCLPGDRSLPKPGPLQVHLRDDHMRCTITWLAGLLLIAFAVLLRGRMPAPS